MFYLSIHDLWVAIKYTQKKEKGKLVSIKPSLSYLTLLTVSLIEHMWYTLSAKWSGFELKVSLKIMALWDILYLKLRNLTKMLGRHFPSVLNFKSTLEVQLTASILILQAEEKKVKVIGRPRSR